MYKNGTEGFRYFSADFAELKAWLLAKWLWNPDLPAEPLLNEFFTGYYGAAAPLVRRYFDELHTFHNDPATKPLFIYEDITTPVIPDDFYTRAAGLWQQAEAAVKDSPAHAYNVRMGAIPVLYARLCRMPAYEVWVTADPLRYQQASEQRALATDLLARCKEAGTVRISEDKQRHGDTLARWATLAKAQPQSAVGQTRAIVEDKLLSLGSMLQGPDRLSGRPQAAVASMRG
jgi:hypothetical protein